MRRRRVERRTLVGLGWWMYGMATACFWAPALPEPTTVDAVEPQGLIEPASSVHIVFSRPVSAEGRLLALDRDGVPIPITVTADGHRWRLTPQPVWPAGELVRVTADGELVDVEESRVVWPEGDVFFEVAPRPLAHRWAVRWPTPGLPAPAGLRWLALEGAGTSTTVWLVADDHRIPGRRREHVDGLVRFVLEEGPCFGLCANTTYRIEAGAGDEVMDGIRGQVRTATDTDENPPRFEVAEVEVRPGRIEVRWACDEPVLVTARVLGEGLDFEAGVGLGRTGVWNFDAPLEPGRDYDLTVTAHDLVDRLGAGPERRVVGPAEVQVVLRELVPTPRSDWGDSEPRGQPFDQSPGSGTVSSADEWIELVNASEQSIDITAAGLRILTLDRTPAETTVVTAPALRFGDGGAIDRWRPGEALVVRPRGDMSQSDLTVEVWAGALLLDRLVLGDGPDADHPGGGPPDLEREALSRSVDGRWRWCRPTPGDARPNDACGQ